MHGLPTRSLEDRNMIELEHHNEWHFFTQKSSAKNTLMGPDNTILGMNLFVCSTVINIKGLSKYKIVEKITNHKQPDKHTANTILATLKLFWTPMEFLDMLILRFHVPPPLDQSDDALRSYTTDYQSPIQLRVANLIKTWLSSYWYYFEEDPQLKEKLVAFVHREIKPSLLQLGTSLEQDIIAKSSGAPPTLNCPDPILPDSSVTLETAKITDFNPLEVSRQCPSKILTTISSPDS